MQEYFNEYAEHWFHTPTPLEKAGGIWPIRAGKNDAKPNYKIGPRIIMYYSLHFVIEGKVIFSYSDKQVTLSQGDMFCLYPHQTHEYQIHSAGKPLRMFWLAFDGKQSSLLLNGIGLSTEIPYLRKILTMEIRDMTDHLSHLFRDESENLSLMIAIYSLFQNLTLLTQPSKLYSDKSYWLNRCLNYMNLHYSERITVEDVAHYAGIHRSHFTKTFTDKQGISPLQYMQNLKMKKAANMLSETSYSITEIALTIGYPDLYSFSRAFRNYYGIPPSKYKRNINFPE